MRPLFRVLAMTAALVAIGFSSAAEVRKVVVAVEGMSCPFCAFGVEKKLRTVPGTAEVSVDMGDGTATLSPARGDSIEVTAVPEAIRRAGFTPGEVRVWAVGALATGESGERVLRVEGTVLELVLEGAGPDLGARLGSRGSRVEVEGLWSLRNGVQVLTPVAVREVGP